MSFLKSNQIKVFPATGRSETYEESFLTTEDNITNIGKTIHSSNDSSWVVSSKIEVPFKFVINGYSFEISDETILTGNLYATIYLQKTLSSGDYQRLVNQDSSKTLDNGVDTDSEFTGLTLTTEKPASVDNDSIKSYTLKLLNNGEVPSSSKSDKYTISVDEPEKDKVILTIKANY